MVASVFLIKILIKILQSKRDAHLHFINKHIFVLTAYCVGGYWTECVQIVLVLITSQWKFICEGNICQSNPIPLLIRNEMNYFSADVFYLLNSKKNKQELKSSILCLAASIKQIVFPFRVFFSFVNKNTCFEFKHSCRSTN